MSEKKDTRVALFVPKGGVNDEPNFMIGINGQIYLLPRGKKSLVPAFVAAEFERAMAAQDKLDCRMDSLQSAH